MTPTSPPQDETPLNQPGQPCRTPQAVGNRTCCVHCGFFLSQHVAPDETPQGDLLARAELPCDACVLCRARKCLEELRKRAEAAEAEIARLTKMRTHCSNCGGDYLATGVEVGCPCLVLARAEAAEAALTKVREELEHEQQTSLDDPAEQRAERYAMEAYELAGKLIKAEASLASYAEGAREIAEEMLAATDNAAIAAREGWAEAILALGPRS